MQWFGDFSAGHDLASALSLSASFTQLCLQLFFNSLTHSLSSLSLSFQFGCPMLVTSYVALIPTQVLPFVYLFTAEHTWRATCISAPHANNSLKATTATTIVHLLIYLVSTYLPAPLLTPVFFLHPFHTTGFAGQTPDLGLLTTVCEALGSERSL